MNTASSERAIILAPMGRDAGIAAAMLNEAGIESTAAPGHNEFIRELIVGAGFALVTDEALRGADLRSLDSFLCNQGPWSDFPFILLTERGGGIERNPAARRYIDLLGNVTFIERPFHPTTLISIARAALRGRRRQYETRDQLRTIKASEEALRNLASELEARVEQRTRQHDEVTAQLHEARKLETLGQLTGGVAHDFNNLLTPIVGGLDILRRRIDDPKLRRLIDGALESSERARTLVARLLSFARRQNLEARAVDVRDLVEGMAELIQRSVGQTVVLDVDTGAGPATALIDPNQLELALLNLAVNARDAMPGGGRLTIEVEGEAEAPDLTLPPGPYVRIRVCDTGVGMDAATLAHAIEPFYSTKGVGKGTGLGLSMVHGLAAQSGGRLVMTSSPGEGTKAELWLPASAVAAAARSPRDQGALDGETFRLLLVDDEGLIRQGAAQMLRDLGHDVVQAGSGPMALGLLRSQPFEMLVTDYLMPGMNGLELARAARAIHPGLPVLMITGFADLAPDTASDVARLAKPFRLAELSRAIQDQAKAQPRVNPLGAHALPGAPTATRR